LERFPAAQEWLDRASFWQAKWAAVMRAPLIAVVLSSVGRAVCAQPADEGSKMLDTCFELARAADADLLRPEKRCG